MKAFCITGYSGSGKTTLLEGLIPLIVARGLKVSLIKHTHHNFDVDRPGKDSYRLREAGCTEVMLLSNTRWALMHELRGGPEPDLAAQLAVRAQRRAAMYRRPARSAARDRKSTRLNSSH